MNRKLAIIIALQGLLIILLFWILVFFGKDEYEVYNKGQLDEIESPKHVTVKQGQSVVSIPIAVQQNSQITTANLLAAKNQPSVTIYGTVVSIDGLIEAKTKLSIVRTEADLVRNGAQVNLHDYERLKLLNDDDKNVSDRTLQLAEALVNADLAKIKNADSNYATIKKITQLQWGETLTKLVTETKLSPHLAALLARKNILVQMNWPIDNKAPVEDTIIHLQSINDVETISAVYVSASLQSDNPNSGITYYFSAPAERLRVGMRVKSQIPSNEKYQSNGVIIPNSALVWYGGKPWVYIKQSDESFVRKPMIADHEVIGGWFNPTGFKSNETVVTSGAQLLLSEEFKYQIKNENQD